MSISLMTDVWRNPCPSHTQQLVLIALADNANDEGGCWPGIEHLAKKCALSRQAVMDQIEALEKSGRLRVNRTPGRVNEYQLPVNGVYPSTSFTRQRGRLHQSTGTTGHQSTPLTPPVNAVDPNRQEASDVNRQLPISPPLPPAGGSSAAPGEAAKPTAVAQKAVKAARLFRDYPEDFEAFWSRYPRDGEHGAGSKSGAFDEWEGVRVAAGAKWPEVTTEISDSLTAHLASKQWKDDKKNPHASTWLHQGRFQGGQAKPASKSATMDPTEWARS